MALDTTAPETSAADDPWPPRTVDLRSDDWLSPGQATGIARVTLRTMRRWIARRPIAIKIEGRVYVSRRRLMTLCVTTCHRDPDAD